MPTGKGGRPEKAFDRVRAARLLMETDMSLQEIADEVGVSKTKIWHFKNEVEENRAAFELAVYGSRKQGVS